MNIFLLGNGFDLHHKFPTAYIDFLNTVNYLANVDNCAKIKTIYDVFGDEELQASCKNIKRCVEQHDEILKKIILPEHKIAYFKEKSKSNLWFQYLSKILNRDLGWIDFEREIAIVIEAFRFFFNHIGRFNRTDEDERNMYIVLQFSFFSEIEKDLFDDCAFWSVDEVKDEYKTEVPIGSGLFEINKTKIVDELYEELEELSEMLRTYLECFVENIIDKLDELKYISTNPSYEQYSNYIFTFNYTNTEKLLDKLNTNVVHIHGDLNKGIILGINSDKYDELECADISFVTFKKYYQRMFRQFDRSYRIAIDNIAYHRTHRDRIKLFVIGHSLDVTDKDIITDLFGLASDITIFYHSESAKGDYIKNLIGIFGKSALDSINNSKDIKFVKHIDVNWSIKDDQL